ncbi:MAG TPA: hypothetical protein PLC74_00475 [Acetobacteraceae bacterium]|nr:hypothetical protein [Acetobacteraceae bacterium]
MKMHNLPGVNAGNAIATAGPAPAVMSVEIDIGLDGAIRLHLNQ